MYVILVLMILVVVSTITTGVVIEFKGISVGQRKCKSALRLNLSAFVPALAAAVLLLIPQVAHAADGGTGSTGLGLLAAALSTGLATIGTGYAVGVVGSSALGAISENPGLLGRTLIILGLAEGIAIYGLIVSIMILGKI